MRLYDYYSMLVLSICKRSTIIEQGSKKFTEKHITFFLMSKNNFISILVILDSIQEHHPTKNFYYLYIFARFVELFLVKKWQIALIVR